MVAKNLAVAEQVVDKLKQVSGAVDVHIQQVYDLPAFKVSMDRSKSEQLGVTGRDIANSVLVALSGSFQTTPTFFLNPKTGVTYNVVVQAPQYNISSLQDLQNIPIHPLNGGNDQILANLTQITRAAEPGIIYHYNTQPVIDIYANVQGRDLGAVADDVKKILVEVTGSDGSTAPPVAAQVQSTLDSLGIPISVKGALGFVGIHDPKPVAPTADLPRSTTVTLRGQVQTMQESFSGLASGMIGAIILVYLLMVVNFQSWVEPFIIIMALPGALAGICWMLFLSGTTVSVPALMGAIMCIGVATANSILVIAFAREKRANGMDGYQAVLAAGVGRLRPVIMTASAMIIGMVPMALGEGEGGEQNAPLGRAVIGGLIVATFATLFFVPVVYRIIRGGRPYEPAPVAPEQPAAPAEPEHEYELEQPEPALT
jgi:multidrug efflux pump subunit AcrB